MSLASPKDFDGSKLKLDMDESQTQLLVQFVQVLPRPAIHLIDPIAPLPDPRFSRPPTWETQLKEVAPNVYAYIQAGGPGRDNASVANAGIIVGDSGVAVIDTLTAPLHAQAFIAGSADAAGKPRAPANSMNGAQWLTIGEAAAWLGVSRTTVYALVAAGELWRIKVGRAVRFPVQALEEFRDRKVAEARSGNGVPLGIRTEAR